MTLFVISIPLMVLAVALAVLPLILMSFSDHRRRTAETTPRNRWGRAQEVAAMDEEAVPIAA
jgi:hypothetical protein